jgi:hypothetical protein
MGVKLKLSTSYHPEMDGASELNQCIQFHIKRNQRGWVKSLPLICFNYMSTVNKSTGFSPFQLQMGQTPQMVPPLILMSTATDMDNILASKFIKKIHLITLEVKDNLTCTKISQALQSNKSQTLTFPFKVGDHVQLSTFYRRCEYKASGELPVAKFMPRFDSPFRILDANQSNLTVRLKLPENSKTHPVFHTSQVLLYKENDTILFPSREFSKPLPIITDTGNKEYFV